MKIKTAIMILLFTVCLSSCHQSAKTPNGSMTGTVNEQKEVISMLDSFNIAAANADSPGCYCRKNGRAVGAIILLLTAAFSCFTNIFGDVLATPRLLFAGANDGLFPKFLGKVHPKFATPHLAIIVWGSLIFLFSVSGGFKQMAILASASILIIYLTVILATIKMRTKKQEASGKTFKIPGGLTVPLIGIAAIGWMFTSLGKWEILSVLIFIAIVCVIYFVMKKIKKEKTIPVM